MLEKFKEATNKNVINVPITKQDKDDFYSQLKFKIKNIKSIDEIINLYETQKNSTYLNFRRHNLFDTIKSGFGFFKKNHTNTKIQFIEALQNRVLQIVYDLKCEIRSAVLEKLVNHDLFSKVHYELGVKTRPVRETLESPPANLNKLVFA